MHRTPRLLLAVLSVLTLALAACGGDDLASRSAPDVLAEAFGPDKQVESGRLDLRISLDATGLQGLDRPLKLSLTGPFAATGARQLPRLDLDAELDLAGQALSAGVVSTGDRAWLELAGQAFLLDAPTLARFRALYRQGAGTSGAQGAAVASLGIHPERWLSQPREVGEERVGGTQTVHVSSTVDVPALLDDVVRLLRRADATGAAAAAGAQGVPTALTAAQRRQVEQAVKHATVDVYAGKDDGTLRRLNVQVAFAVPAADRAAGGSTSGRLALDLVITGLNEPQRIVPPASARPLSDLRRGATGASGAAGTTGAGGGSGEAAYRRCLDAAGSDIAEVQTCAPLLNGG